MATATPAINSFTVSSTNIAINVTAGSETTHVQWDRSWVDNGGGSNDLEVALSTGSSYTQNFTPPSAKGNYTVSVRARIGSTASSWVSRGFTISDPDPAIVSLSVSATGTISATWGVTNASYMRTSSSMAVYLSGANNSTQHFMGYVGYNTRSFESSLAGDSSALIVGASYRVWVFAYDTDGNSFGANSSAVFSRPRPDNFSWTNNKSSGSMYNLTSSEWNAFLDKVNNFRAYKGLVVRTFSRNVGSGAISGYVVPTASSFNSAINAINDMNPTTSTPVTVSYGQHITAFHFTRIRDSLNSIT